MVSFGSTALNVWGDQIEATWLCVATVQSQVADMTMNLSSVSQLLDDMENWDKDIQSDIQLTSLQILSKRFNCELSGQEVYGCI